MAKKFGKFLAFAAIAGAAAGAYHYMKSRSKNAELDDFDDFDDEDDISLEEYLKEEASQSEQTERSIKSRFPISAETVSGARESLKKAVMDIGGKVAGVADSISGVVKSGSSEQAENFQFYDLSKEDDIVTPTDDRQIDIINMKKPEAPAESSDSASEEPAGDAAAESEAGEDKEPTTADILS